MLRAVLSLAMLVTMLACEQQATKENPSTSNADSTQQNSEAKNKEIVTRLYEEVINNKNIALINELYVSDVVDHSAWPGQPPGRDGIRQAIQDFHKSYSSLRVQVDEVITKDDKVITRESWSGVSNATNEPDSGTVMHIFTLKNGKVTEEWSEGWEWLQ